MVPLQKKMELGDMHDGIHFMPLMTIGGTCRRVPAQVAGTQTNMHATLSSSPITIASFFLFNLTPILSFMHNVPASDGSKQLS